jgi:hypothetical protein
VTATTRPSRVLPAWPDDLAGDSFASVRGPHGALDVRRAVRSVASATGVAPAATAAAKAVSTSSRVLTVQASVMADHPFGPWLPADFDCGTMAAGIWKSPASLHTDDALDDDIGAGI